MTYHTNTQQPNFLEGTPFPNANGMGGQAPASIQLTSIKYLHMPVEQKQHYHPIVSNYDQFIEKELVEATNGCANLSACAIGHVANQIIMPSIQSQGIITIANGWENARFAVYMEFEVTKGNTTTVELLIGYTNYLGVSLQRNYLDPEMTITISSRVTLRTYSSRQGNSNNFVTGHSMTGHQHILGDTGVIQGSGKMAVLSNAVEAMRPSDTLGAIHRVNVPGSVQDVVDSRNMLTSRGLASNTLNTNSAEYVAKVLTSFSQAMDVEDSYSNDMYTVGDAVDLAADETIYRSPVLAKLLSSTSMETCGIITVGELANLWPTVHAQAIVSTPAGGVPEDQRTNFEHNGAPTIENTIKTQLTHAIPNILTGHLMATYTFVATIGINGAVNVVSPDCAPLSKNIMLTEAHRNKVNDKVAIEVLRIAHAAGAAVFTIAGTCRIFGTSIYNISVNDGPAIPFSAPNYCDRLTNPLLSLHQQQTNTLGSEIQKTLQTVRSQNISAI